MTICLQREREVRQALFLPEFVVQSKAPGMCVRKWLKCMTHIRWRVLFLVVVVLALAARSAAGGHASVAAQTTPTPPTSLGVQAFLEQQPGVLKSYSDEGETAAAIIEGQSLYYGISPYLHLALLETTSNLLSDPNPPAEVLRQPYGSHGPEGFAAQIAWASRALRAGYGPYDAPPTLRFDDDTTVTLTLDQAPEGVAVQRFLAEGRTRTAWYALTDRFAQVFQDYFNNELPEIAPTDPSGKVLEIPTSGFLQCPWPMGVRVVHLAYFDHAYPTVDSGADGNSTVVTYAGSSDVQYNSHDGHDYVFPDNPIGSPILAAAPGIGYARIDSHGKGIVILHAGGYETVYWHLNSFAPKFRNVVNSSQGVWVESGEVMGTSGKTGFSYGTPHLHFEVRHYGRQVDPYGWHGEGADPCTGYAACEDRGWLWHGDLYGTYDFTPPDHVNPEDGRLQTTATVDETPPLATVAVNPPDDLLLAAHFDGHLLQTVGQGQPAQSGVASFDAGRYDRALSLSGESGVSYPTAGNMNPEAGTLSVWVHVPEEYPQNSIGRHYVLAASASPYDSEHGYPGTFALRRDGAAEGGEPRWNFWTTAANGEAGRDDLTAPDTLYPGWHHLALTWEAASESKALYINGSKVAATRGITLPMDIGPALNIGRFNRKGTQSGIMVDDLAIFGRVLPERDIAALASSRAALPTSTTALHEVAVLLDTNASDEGGVIVAMQPGVNGVFDDPRPYEEQVRWSLPPIEGEHTLAVRYFDRASNRQTVTQTVRLSLPPRGDVAMVASDDIGATVAISATDSHVPIAMQVSQWDDFRDAEWESVRPYRFHVWREDAPQRLVVRFQDGAGDVSEPLVLVGREPWVYLPRVER